MFMTMWVVVEHPLIWFWTKESFCKSWILLMVALLLAGVCSRPAYAISVVDVEWNTAHASFYGTTDGVHGSMGDASGYRDLMTDSFGAYNTALSGALFQNGDRCGACYEIKCFENGHGWCLPRTSVLVTATNFCPGGSGGPNYCQAPHQHFDMAIPVFTTIAKTDSKMIPVEYRRMPCKKKQGGIKFFTYGDTTHQSMLLYNVGGMGDVARVAVKGDTNLIEARRSWGANWHFEGNLRGQALSIFVVNFAGTAVLSGNVADSHWAYGQTFEGAQF